jgi:hypothetical protein
MCSVDVKRKTLPATIAATQQHIAEKPHIYGFPSDSQVAFDDGESRCYFRASTGWNIANESGAVVHQRDVRA